VSSTTRWMSRNNFTISSTPYSLHGQHSNRRNQSESHKWETITLLTRSVWIDICV